jgi:flagellar biogenesis protein FliO
MLFSIAALGGILLAAGTAEPGYSPYAPPGRRAPGTSHAPAAYHGPAAQPVAAGHYRSPAANGAAPQYSGYPRRDWSGPAVRHAAYEEPAPKHQDEAAPSRRLAPAAVPAPRGAGTLPVTPRGADSSVPLPPPGASPQSEGQAKGAGPASAVTIVGALGLVLGIFLLTAWGIRRAAPQGLHPLPGEVFEVLGRAPLAGRQQAHLLRLGNKLMLVSVSPAGAETLAEITDPVEVDRVAGLCRQSQPGSATAVFRQVFEQFAPRRPAAHNVERTSSPSHETPYVERTSSPSHEDVHQRRTASPSYEGHPYGTSEYRHG